MRQETNKEMDLLLRRLGRRDDATVSNGVGDHLDADELSAYAEQALPPAARARYTAHLAECTRCRELVVQLSASAGVVSAAETAKVSARSGFEKFLASLFTPMVLRYAAPALGLIVVAVIGLVVLRRDRAATDYVTQVTNNEQSPTPPPVAESAARAVESPAKIAASPEANAERKKENQQTDSTPPPPPNAAPVISIQTEVAKDAAAAQPKQEQTATANEAPPPPAKPAPTTKPDEQRQAEIEVNKRQVAAQPAASRAPETALQAQERADRRTQGFSDDGKATDAITPQTGGATGSKLKRHDLNLSANTRSVAGRRFAKKGGVWIDTGYDSSRNAVTLTRGSEQYRALVADEPEIKKIADELDGEIIVVWKGRTYRIR